MSPILEKSLQNILEPVASEIGILDGRLINDICPSSRALSSILEDIFKAGGKRLRPALSFLIYKAFVAGEVPEEIYLISEISELIHTASLVHDDIIDNSFVRRGKPTANSKWDNAVTVISGDFMFARAAVNLGKVGINDITALFAKVLEDLCDGEIRQVEKRYTTDIDWDYYFSKSYKKTASLFEASTKAPLIAAKFDSKFVNAAAAYGKYLGLAFQIIDDILDYASDEKSLGKPVGADLKEGQITIPVLYALEELKRTDTHGYEILQQKITELAADNSNEKLLAEIISLIKGTNAIETSYAKAESYIQKAITELNVAEDSKFKTALIELAEFTVSRKN